MKSKKILACLLAVVFVASALTMTMMTSFASNVEAIALEQKFEIGRREASQTESANLGNLRIQLRVGALINDTTIRLYGDSIIFAIPAAGGVAAHNITINLGTHVPGFPSDNPAVRDGGFENILLGTDYRGTGFPQRWFRYNGHTTLFNAGVVGGGTLTDGGTPAGVDNYIEFNPDSQQQGMMLFDIVIANNAGAITSDGAAVSMATNAGLQSIADRINTATNRNGIVTALGANNGIVLFTAQNIGTTEETETIRLYEWVGASVMGGSADTIGRSDDFIYSSFRAGFQNDNTAGGYSDSTDPYFVASHANAVTDIFGLALWGSGHDAMRPKLLSLMRSGADLVIEANVFATGGTARERQLRLVAARDKHNWRSVANFAGEPAAWYDSIQQWNNWPGIGAHLPSGRRLPATSGTVAGNWQVETVTGTGLVTFTIPNSVIWNPLTEEFNWDVLYLEKWIDTATGTAAAIWNKSNNTTHIQLDSWVITAVLPADKPNIGDGGGSGGGLSADVIILDRKTYTLDDLVKLVAGAN